MASPFVELEIGGHTVKVTNPDKVYFRDRRADQARPCAVLRGGRRGHRPRAVRAADAAEAPPRRARRTRRSTRSACPAHAPDWIETARVTFPSGRHADELCVTERRAGRVGGEPRHDRLPPVAVAASRHRAPGRAAHRRRPAARHDVRGRQARRGVVHEVLDEIGYVGWPKTSGNRGIHVFCRIEPQLGVHASSAAARWRSRARSSGGCPDIVTTAWWKEERGEKVFIDYNQNARDRTIASAYSVRGAAGRDRVGAGHLGRAPGRRDRGLHDPDDARAVRRSSATCRPGSTTP